MSRLSQLKFIITDWWKSYDPRPTDYSSAQALRDSSHVTPSEHGVGSSPRSGFHEMAAEANDRYLESFDKKD